MTCLNPKSLTFFVAFLPQFVDPSADFASQMAIFIATFMGLAFANAIGYATLASRARGFVQSEAAMGVVNKTGALLIGAAVATAGVRASQ